MCPKCCPSQAEELIKREMVTMLHHDAVYSPTPGQQGLVPGSKKPSQKAVVNQAAHLAFLESHKYDTYEEEEIAEVSMPM